MVRLLVSKWIGILRSQPVVCRSFLSTTLPCSEINFEYAICEDDSICHQWSLPVDFLHHHVACPSSSSSICPAHSAKTAQKKNKKNAKSILVEPSRGFPDQHTHTKQYNNTWFHNKIGSHHVHQTSTAAVRDCKRLRVWCGVHVKTCGFLWRWWW